MAKKRPYQIEFFGNDALLRALEEMEESVVQAIAEAVEASVDPVEKDLHQFTNVEHKLSGDTEDAYVKKGFKKKETAKTINAWVGYDVKKGGEAAIFLQVGTPKMAPHHFITHAYHNNKDEVMEIQQRYLEEYVEKKMKQHPPKVDKI